MGVDEFAVEVDRSVVVDAFEVEYGRMALEIGQPCSVPAKSHTALKDVFTGLDVRPSSGRRVQFGRGVLVGVLRSVVVGQPFPIGDLYAGRDKRVPRQFAEMEPPVGVEEDALSGS